MKTVLAIMVTGVVTGVALCATQARAQQTAPACAALVRAMGKDAQPRFLVSYPTSAEPALRETAFLYDNAAAAIALVGCGARASAARIGDAMLAALARDRHWQDGRLRNAYRAGAVAGGAAALPGWWDAGENRWVEDRYQAGSDTGNMAWAVLALLALDDGAADRRYRDGAVRIGAWLLRQRSATGGFTGGALGHEPSPDALPWKSTEHHADLAAAFGGLARATGEPRWRTAQDDAVRFVRAMWRADCGCFAAGTGADGVTRNPLLALDAQVWPLLALRESAARRAQVVAMVRARLSGGGGFSYSETARGFWTEGSAQMALLLRLSGAAASATDLLRTIGSQRHADGWYNAAAATLETGFAADADPSQARRYFRLPHLGATAWVALAQTGFNPFTRRRTLP